MSFHGDIVNMRYAFLPHNVGENMATAIARKYTKNGFVIAADGRVINADDQSIVTESAQKIFQIGRYLSISLTGAIKLTKPDSDLVVFDFVEHVQSAAQEIGGGHKNLYEYVSAIGLILHKSLLAASAEHGLVYDNLPPEEDKPGSHIATILFDGYFNSLPRQADLRIYHENQKLADPEVLASEARIGLGTFGSQKVAEAFGQDSRFGKYRTLDVPHEDRTMRQAINEARCYIRCCDSPEGNALDPEICRIIGGDIHIATITKHQGFQWVPGFEPQANRARANSKGARD